MEIATSQARENLSALQNSTESLLIASLTAPVHGIVILLESLLPVIILLSMVNQLWKLYIDTLKDTDCPLPLPPGAVGLPFFGETFNYLFNIENFTSSRRKAYGNVFKTHLLGKPTIRIIGAENVKKLLLSEHNMVQASPPASVRMLVGEGAISISSGAIHKCKRKAIIHVFSPTNLQRYLPHVQDIIRNTFSSWSEENNVLAFQESRALSFKISARALLGLHMDADETRKMLRNFETFVESVFSMPVDLPGSGVRRGLKCREYLISVLEKHIIARAESDSAADSSTDVLGYLLNYVRDVEGDEEEPIKFDDIKDLLLELLFAGVSTTASAMTSCLYLLTQHPECIAHVRDELKSAQISVDNLHSEDLRKLPYVNNVVKEVLRLMPPVGAGFRKAIKTFEMEGVQIPAGWQIMYSIRDTHQTSPLFPDSSEFKPERWSNIDSEQRFHFLPFGGGHRACAGKDFAQLILKMFVVELCSGYSWSTVNSNTEFRCRPAPVPTDGCPVAIRKLL